jgi:hypothetical protein
LSLWTIKYFLGRIKNSRKDGSAHTNFHKFWIIRMCKFNFYTRYVKFILHTDWKYHRPSKNPIFWMRIENKEKVHIDEQMSSWLTERETNKRNN